MTNKFLIFIENRTDKVKISLLVDGVAIKDASGNNWNEKIINLSRAQNSELPYEAVFSGATAITWKGEMSSGELADGPHTLKLKVWDNEISPDSPNQAPDLDTNEDGVLDTQVDFKGNYRFSVVV